MKNGVRYAFTGNVRDPAGQTTYCHQCQAPLIGRDWHEITAWHLTYDGKCETCGTACAGLFDRSPGTWGSKRLPVNVIKAGCRKAGETSVEGPAFLH
jgi:pyruvate formate lyase activating enzyme